MGMSEPGWSEAGWNGERAHLFEECEEIVACRGSDVGATDHADGIVCETGLDGETMDETPAKVSTDL